jgi:type IV pilus assembly protein PilB
MMVKWNAPFKRVEQRSGGKSKEIRLGGNDLIDGTRLLKILLKNKVITPEQAKEIEMEHKVTGSPVTTLVARLGVADENKILEILSNEYKIPTVDLNTINIDETLLRLIPPDIAKKYKVIPIGRKGRVITVAMATPYDMEILDDLKFITGFDIEPVLASEKSILDTINRAYGGENTLHKIVETLEEEFEIIEDKPEEPDVNELSALIEEAPVVKLVNGIISEAVRRNASDIHVEPYEKFVRVRVRVDGVLHELMAIPYKLKDAVVSRIKVMARLDIAERRLPQDGHIKMKFPDKTIDLRVSTLPTLFGEKVVMRILDKSNLTLDLSKLGFEEEALKNFLDAISKPYGLILVTGPTGSGKTTTLYSAINRLNSPDVNILTVEDPVEYDFPGINQVQVKEEVGLTFASVLRSFLRQDPDIILVGEIRDAETATIAIRAALTGHLVLSTLHTNDAPSAVSRLIDMGIEPFLVAASLNLVVAQRLMRKICSHCKEPAEIDEVILARIGMTKKDIEGKKVYRGKGCQRCNNTGYSGRIGIYEVMPVSPEIREMILRGVPIHEIREKAIEEGMITLRDAALRKFLRGLTTIDEVIRVTAEE